MSNRDCSTGDLREYIQQAHDHLKENIMNVDKKIDSIHMEVKKTNGRVTRLETWRWIVTGFVLCLSIFVVPIIVQYLKNMV